MWLLLIFDDLPTLVLLAHRARLHALTIGLLRLLLKIEFLSMQIYIDDSLSLVRISLLLGFVIRWTDRVVCIVLVIARGK